MDNGALRADVKRRKQKHSIHSMILVNNSIRGADCILGTRSSPHGIHLDACLSMGEGHSERFLYG